MAQYLQVGMSPPFGCAHLIVRGARGAVDFTNDGSASIVASTYHEAEPLPAGVVRLTIRANDPTLAARLLMKFDRAAGPRGTTTFLAQAISAPLVEV